MSEHRIVALSGNGDDDRYLIQRFLRAGIDAVAEGNSSGCCIIVAKSDALKALKSIAESPRYVSGDLNIALVEPGEIELSESEIMARLGPRMPGKIYRELTQERAHRRWNDTWKC